MNIHDLPLKRIHAHARDNFISFCSSTHTYTVARGGGNEKVPVSVTSFAKAYFEQFDGNAVVDKNYPNWKRYADSKYYAQIHSVLHAGGSDADAKQAILDQWSRNSKVSSREGTLMHEHAEYVCNGIELHDPSPEMVMLTRWLKEFQPHMQWEPVRTEWILWWELVQNDSTSPVMLAGTLDLLMWSKTMDVYGLFDFKRTNPKPKFKNADPNLLGPHTRALYHPGYAMPPLQEAENSDYGKYTMQLNILAKMLRERYDIDVASNMFLLQIHPDMSSAHCVQVSDLRQATDSLFAIEEERTRQATLARIPPPANQMKNE
tara:strand:+ start:1165 stop:2118 length:954 start_codon:yes stop_codon:yes gene_type:complete